MAFRPLGDRVLVKRVEEETKTKGGIIIPDTAKEKPQEGEVIAVGPGRSRDDNGKIQPLDVKKGDRILFGKWSGTEVKIDGEDLLIMKESDILGVIDPVVAQAKVSPKPLAPSPIPVSFLPFRRELQENGCQRRLFLPPTRAIRMCCGASTSSPTR